MATDGSGWPPVAEELIWKFPSTRAPPAVKRWPHMATRPLWGTVSSLSHATTKSPAPLSATDGYLWDLPGWVLARRGPVNGAPVALYRWTRTPSVPSFSKP